ncbi:type-F conjugative transfer system pilin assembly thiol-disulfide isomerase TrbB [Legionella massiliensis]|uniref:Type-F conjugative transfer system pilin assembly thiol-disulfide isomerase TrbB n=1 Tax=Legionella massiliensis TaxID=1034943 RepID=A0A078L4D6_9GAMM|nr:hypothetical protein [Legionella massiliensis]CDZ78798.1 type-F conjugative transfer system pilin assembly thiol-disulfide isomerase TrbB [Legionella massiliensis]CEE14536.1 hypothetical protein BN1094_03112 [Legionella massiliensis]
MQIMIKSVIAILFFIFTPLACAASTDSAPWFSKAGNNQIKLRVDLFMASTCPHCQQADAFFRDLQAKRPWLDVHRYEINQDKQALEYFRQQLNLLKTDDYSVPAVLFCNSRWVGFDKPETTGQVLAKSLDFCYQQITKTGELKSNTVKILTQWANASFLAGSLTPTSKAIVVIPLIASMDSLNSCSIFCLLALFSFLWLYKDKSIMLGLGILFIVVVAVVHHFQQNHAIFFYQVLHNLRILAALIGLGLIAYVFVLYSKGANVQPGIVIPILVGLTALVIESYQQVCLPNFALIFTQWLDAQKPSSFAKGIYAIFYSLVYVIPLILFMVLLIYCRVKKKIEKCKAVLVCMAWCLLLIIGIILVIYPRGLSNYLCSVLALLLSFVAAWLTVRRARRLKNKQGAQ